MKAMGIVRQVDELGRVVIPIELRRRMGIGPGTPMEFAVADGGYIVLRPAVETPAEKRAHALTYALQSIDKHLGGEEVDWQDVRRVVAAAVEEA